MRANPVEHSESVPVPELAERLGYLFKHAHVRLTHLTTAALAPLGIGGSELAVLLVIVEGPPASQLDIAKRMGVDRTTMVTLIDELERKGLVQRSPDPNDRRRNVTALTSQGRKTTRRAVALSEEAEKSFLEPLSTEEAATIRRALRHLAFPSRA